MTEPDSHPRRPTVREFLFDLVTQRLLTLVGLVLIAGAVVLMVGIDVSIPRWLRLGLIVSPLGLLCGHYASKFVIGLLPDPHIVWLVDVDLLDDDGAGLFALPAEDMADLDVTEGQLWAPAPNLRFGKAVDLEEMTVEGTWRGTISDAEMLRALSMVRECRGELEEDFGLEDQIRHTEPDDSGSEFGDDSLADSLQDSDDLDDDPLGSEVPADD